MNIQTQVQELLQREKYCIVSTVNANGSPESAFVAFSENNKLELMIGTSKKSRKFKNILANPNVAVVIGSDGKSTLQYEGIVRIAQSEELEDRLVAHHKKQPGAKKYQSDPSEVYLLVLPKWLRLTKSGPIVIGEMRFDSR